MVTRVLVHSSNAVYFVENETVRGLIVLISEAGLSLGPLLSSKKSLTESLLFHLGRRNLAVLQVKFRDRTGQIITTGYGLWSFYVKYDALGRGSVELPVNTILGDLRRNPHALKGVIYGAPLGASGSFSRCWSSSGAGWRCSQRVRALTRLGQETIGCPI